MEKYQVLLKICMAGVPLFTILAALCGFGWNYYGLKIKELEKVHNERIKDSISSKKDSIKSNNTYYVSGDLVKGNKSIKHDEIIAPNALIVTKNQSGGQNTVNVYQNEFKPLDNALETIIEQKLSVLANQYNKHPQIIIEIESNNSQRNKIALYLEKLLSKNNLGTYPKGNTYTGRFPDNPISVIINPKNKDYTDKFLDILRVYIKDKYQIIQDDHFSLDFIKFYINGQPLFENNGTVKIE